MPATTRKLLAALFAAALMFGTVACEASVDDDGAGVSVDGEGEGEGDD